MRAALGRAVLASACGLGLAGCETLAEQERALAQAQRESCLEAGFAEDSDAFRLCLLLERTNERLARLERRLEFLELEISRLSLWGPWRRWP